jgi:hypothetical protein
VIQEEEEIKFARAPSLGSDEKAEMEDFVREEIEGPGLMSRESYISESS